MPASVVQCEWIMESFLYAIISSISVDSYLLHSISFFPFLSFSSFFVLMIFVGFTECEQICFPAERSREFGVIYC